jgi:hypothetical protein
MFGVRRSFQWVIGREERGTTIVVAAVHDQVKRFLDPLGRLLRADIVQHKNVRRDSGIDQVTFVLQSSRRRVVRLADFSKQRASIIKQDAGIHSLADALHARNREMCLAQPGSAQKEKSFVDHRKRVGELPSSCDCPLQRLRVVVKAIEVALPVP